MAAADPRLHVVLQLTDGDRDARAMGVTDELVATDERGERDALGRRERGVPAGPVLHRLHGVALGVFVRARGLMAHECLVSDRVAALGELLKMSLVDVSGETPFLCEPPVPLAVNLATGRVVVDARVAKLLGVIPGGLSGTEGLGDAEHGDG